MKKLGSKGRRQSVIQAQSDQKAAQDLTKDYQAIVSGDKVSLWPTEPAPGVSQDEGAAVTLDAIDPAQTYYTRNGTKIKLEDDDIFFNDSITTSYAQATKALDFKSSAIAEGDEEEDDCAEEEITVSLKEDLPYSGMELQELKHGVYVRNFFGYPDGRQGSAETAGVKLGCKLFAMKSVPVHKLQTLSSLYQKFKVKQGDMVQFTFDVSDQSSLWNAAAAEDADAPLGTYTALRSCVFREDFDFNSARAGSLEPGDEIEVLEARTNEKGQIRLRFDRGGDRGWVSTVSGDGTALLEPVDSNDTGLNKDGSAKIPKGEYFRVLRAATLKVTFDPKGADAGTIAAGDVIEVFEHGQSKGVNMMRTGAGWTIKEDDDGPLFYKIPEEENMIPFQVDDVLETTGPNHLWKMFGTEEKWEFQVDASLRSLTRRDLKVRTTSVSEENNVVRVGMRKLKEKTSNQKRNESGLVEDVNMLKTDGPLFKVVKQDEYDCNKIMRSLMDLEYDETYLTDNGNTLERRTLQSVTLSGTVDVPIKNPNGWVWMARGNIGATTGSTIHMLLSMMNLEHQVAQPCLIFFVRAANTHPGTVKRLCKGTFTHCTRTTSPCVLVTQCQTAAEMYGDIEEGTYWQAIGRATVRSGAALNSSKSGVLQVGVIVKILETQTENGQLRIRFSSKGLRGWTSVSASNGNTLLEQLPEDQIPAKAREDSSAGAKGGDAGGGGEGCGQYVCIKRAVLREGFEDNSKKCGALKEGDVVIVTEAKPNEKGLLRVKCGEQGWATTTGTGGSTALEFVGATEDENQEADDAAADDDEDDDEVDTDDPNTGQYEAAKPAEVRDGFDADSGVVRKLTVGEMVQATRSKVNAAGQIRVRLAGGGWCSVVSKGGTPLLVKYVAPIDAYSRAKAAAAAAGAASAPVDEADRLDIAGYLDILLSQELETKFGMLEGQSDDGKTLSTDAMIFHCRRPEAVEMLVEKRTEMLTEPEVKPVYTFEDGSINSNFSARLVDVTITDERDEKNGALYVFEIADGTGNTWKVNKRFSAFHQLDKELRKKFPSNQLGKIPSKHKIPGKKDKTGKTELEMRKKAVESYLVLAMMHPQVSQSQEINVFVNEGKQGFEFTEVVEEGKQLNPVHQELLETVEGLTEHSTVREVRELLEKKQKDESPMTFLLEDDHKAFPANEPLASLFNRVQDGADAQDIFLSAAAGRAVARLMLWAYAWTWRNTTSDHDRVQELLYSLLEKSQVPEPDELAMVEASLATPSGRASFCTIAAAMQRSDLGSGKLLEICKHLVDLLLNLVTQHVIDNVKTGAVVLKFTLKYLTTGQDGSERVLPDVVKHPAWTNLEFWEGVLVESLAVAQAEANETEKKSLRKQFIDADNSEANAQRELEERVAYGQMCWLLQQMTLFGAWTSQITGKMSHVFTSDNVEKVRQYIDLCEQTALMREAELASEPEVEAAGTAGLGGHWTDELREGASPAAGGLTVETGEPEIRQGMEGSVAEEDEDDEDEDEEEEDEFDAGGDDDDIEAIAARFAAQQGQVVPGPGSTPASPGSSVPAAGAGGKRRASVSFTSAAVGHALAASSAGADKDSDDSSDSDDSDEDDTDDFLANMGKPGMKASPRILRRPAYGDYTGGRSSASTVTRRASLAGAASGSGSKYSKFGAAARGGAEKKEGSLIDAVLGNEDS